ncbi:hypothetical protein C6P96_11715 [Burkholderia multivorans]|nr:hypothetical protein C6P95_05960 [Burkholderia multivorans]PRF13394.1 hypothetical protein C6P96_11715 [Burkholderia multivorans]
MRRAGFDGRAARIVFGSHRPACCHAARFAAIEKWVNDAFVSAFAHRTRMSAARRRQRPRAPERGNTVFCTACDGPHRAAGGGGAGHVEAASTPR